MANAWWEDCVVYQIYPRSFQDSNGDGIGDLKGIINRLDYLASLSIDAIWLSPIFLSPMADFGYDVSDYRCIASEYGTMEDVEALLREAHLRNIRVIFDMVLNHTSKQHPWFQESRESRNNEKADYYIWSDTIPNNWYAAFGGRAWTYDEKRGQYYLHSFLADQPDLNWKNSKTVDAIFAELRFWLEKGVDGFRLDVINCIAKDDALRNNPKIIGSRPRPYDMQRHIFDRNRPESHQKLKMLRQLMDSFPNTMLVGEILVELPGEPELAASYLGRYNDELHLCFDFSLMYTRFTAQRWTKVAKRWCEAVGRHRVPTWVLNNHDVSRIVSRFKGNEEKARLAAFFILTQRGAVFLYYGEELGLPDSSVKRMNMRDPLGKRYWPFHPGRDPERGPMIWNTGEGKGFSDVDPWLPFAKLANRYSVENQEMEEDSLLVFYKILLAVRKNEEILRKGRCTYLSTQNPHLMAYVREWETERKLCILNVGKKQQTVSLKEFVPDCDAFILTFSTQQGVVEVEEGQEYASLNAYEGCIFNVQ